MKTETEKEIINLISQPLNPGLYSDVRPDRVEARLIALQKKPLVQVKQIGYSRENRPLWGVIVGKNKDLPVIALTGNCHAEEVIGTLSILYIVENLVQSGLLSQLLDKFQFVMIPQMNPDGVMKNWGWLSDPTPANHCRYWYRDTRNEDIEHGIAIGNIDFQRPEPKALVDFYSQYACGKCCLYLTFHSSEIESGAFFLTGNEKVGEMEPAFNLIKDLSSRIGIGLKTEDTRGYYIFRRICDGVYNVPRHEEMSKDFKAAGMKVDSFLLNSVEFMERSGTKISLVSEIPVMQSPAFKEDPCGGSAIDLFTPRIPIIRQSVESKAKLLERMELGDLSQKVQDVEMLKHYRKFFDSTESKEVEEATNYLKCFYGRPALKVHKAKLAGLCYEKQINLAAMVLRVIGDNKEWNNLFQQAFKDLNSIYNLCMTPIEAQVKLHLVLLLSGVKVVSER